MKLNHYKSLVFDCDGVILNSNKIKTDAFYKVSLKLGQEAAKKMVEFHVKNGGISRYKKFEWILQETSGRVDTSVLNELLADYSNEVQSQLLTCEIAPGLQDLREESSASWSVVSGGSQDELRWAFKERKILDYFDAGVFGSPDSKDIILARETASNNISRPALFIGDSYYDHVVSSAAGLDFVFLTEWTEFQEWERYTFEKKITVAKSINELRMRKL